MPRLKIALLLAAFLPAAGFADEPLTIAVASNFTNAAQDVVAGFTKATGIATRISTGSTGKLYAQIVNGAPFDVFLAADEMRPALLEENGLAVAGSRFTYALGSLVLWSIDETMARRDCRLALGDGAFNRLAIANPATAPYGRAAREFLISAGLWEDVSGRMVFGENISQTLQFVVTGNAVLGLVATSQVSGNLQQQTTCSWKVPVTRHSAILQQAVAIAGSRNASSSMRFMTFLRGPVAADILRRHGYEVPE